MPLRFTEAVLCICQCRLACMYSQAEMVRLVRKVSKESERGQFIRSRGTESMENAPNIDNRLLHPCRESRL